MYDNVVHTGFLTIMNTKKTDLNPGFGGPWNKLWIFFVYGTFIMPQKKSFGQKDF